MKNTKGIKATYNVFHVTAIAVVGTEVQSVRFDMSRRDAKAAKAIAAEALGVKPSKVIPSIELEKHSIIIDADSTALIDALKDANITYRDVTPTDNEDSAE